MFDYAGHSSYFVAIAAWSFEIIHHLMLLTPNPSKLPSTLSLIIPAYPREVASVSQLNHGNFFTFFKKVFT